MPPTAWGDLFERAASYDVDQERIRRVNDELDQHGETDDEDVDADTNTDTEAVDDSGTEGDDE